MAAAKQSEIQAPLSHGVRRLALNALKIIAVLVFATQLANAKQPSDAIIDLMDLHPSYKACVSKSPFTYFRYQLELCDQNEEGFRHSCGERAILDLRNERIGSHKECEHLLEEDKLLRDDVAATTPNIWLQRDVLSRSLVRCRKPTPDSSAPEHGC